MRETVATDCGGKEGDKPQVARSSLLATPAPACSSAVADRTSLAGPAPTQIRSGSESLVMTNDMRIAGGVSGIGSGAGDGGAHPAAVKVAEVSSAKRAQEWARAAEEGSAISGEGGGNLDLTSI